MKARTFEDKANELRALLRENGMTVRQLAAEHGLKRQDVADILYLRNKGIRGKAHEAAVALGLKPKPKKRAVLEAA